MLRLPRPLQKSETQPVSGMGEIAIKEIERYKGISQGLKYLGESNRPASHCASPDESCVYYTYEGKDFVITNRQTKELTPR